MIAITKPLEKKFEVGNATYPLSAFESAVWKHLCNCGLDSAFYVLDADAGEMVEIVHCHLRFLLLRVREFVTDKSIMTNADAYHCLQLHKSLYGTTIAPMLWNQELTKGLESRCFCVSAFDPCLFIKGNILIACFVNDCVFCSPSEEINERKINSLRANFDLTDKGDLLAFLGVSILRDHRANSYTFTQAGLIDRILDATGLKNASSNHVPAVPKALGPDPTGLPFGEKWEYASIVGMLMFLANNSRPNIAFATHQCACFTHNTKQSHAIAVKTIVWYLKGSCDKGLIFLPQPNLAVDCFVNADFAGL